MVRMIEQIRRRPYQILLMSAVSTFIILPLLPSGTLGWVLLTVLFTGILLAAVNTVSGVRWRFFLGLALALSALASIWAGQVIPNRELLGIGTILAAVFLALASGAVVGTVLRAPHVTTEVLSGGIAVYLLIGILWALTFSAVGLFAPGSFDASVLLDGSIANPEGFSLVVYYSFVTMTTLGYGDILPVTRLTRTLAIALAVLGQLYLVVLIARLVALHIVHTREHEE
ncbi:MAG: ion channel [Thermoplasmata archaeon]